MATKWEVLSGKYDWEGLLEPDLNNDLREYLIHYGERNQVMGDALIVDNSSPLYLFPRFPMDALFSCVGLEVDNPYKYEVTTFIYAFGTSFFGEMIEDSWIGYIAVATDEGKMKLGRRDIMIVWRGTVGKFEFITDFLQAQLVSASDILGKDHDPKVHYGWHSLYTGKNERSEYTNTSARDQVLNEVRRLVDMYKEEDISITVTGHSMGAAIATLNAMDIVANRYNEVAGPQKKKRKKVAGPPNKICMVTAILFASPRTGDENFKKVFIGLPNLHVLRITNAKDIVPKLPHYIPILFPYIYTHIGVEFVMDTHKSPYLRKNIMEQEEIDHLLEVYLHGIAGTHRDKPFDLVVDRDLALLSKGSMHLWKDSEANNVPFEWWPVEKNNKGMVQQKNGHWKLYVPPPPVKVSSKTN